LAQDLAATREFFSTRAAGWEDRFPDDGPAYAQAVAALALPPHSCVLDVACGTARAAPFLRTAVGPSGTVIALDVTWEMLETARRKGRSSAASFILGDGTALPLASNSLDAVFAAGYLSHVPDIVSAVLELARTTRGGGRMALFHPIGRRALAARHGRDLRDDDELDPRHLESILDAGGWTMESADDGPERYLVVARRATVMS
jgi:SAM-dependent methyltransferase